MPTATGTVRRESDVSVLAAVVESGPGSDRGLQPDVGAGSSPEVEGPSPYRLALIAGPSGIGSRVVAGSCLAFRLAEQ